MPARCANLTGPRRIAGRCASRFAFAWAAVVMWTGCEKEAPPAAESDPPAPPSIPAPAPAPVAAPEQPPPPAPKPAPLPAPASPRLTGPVFELPTKNDGLFRDDPAAFYMFVDRYGSDGKVSQVW